tara:strand:- start:217 stop:1395 length:1179 start_codon:yes stop_codon:yes gene_type:complete
MEEKLIVEIDNNKIKYGVFQIDENHKYKLLIKKISQNAGIKKGKILDFEQSLKIINNDLHDIERKVDKVFDKISIILNQIELFCTNLSGFKKLNGSKVEKRDLDYILNESRNSISNNQKNNSILHILNSNFILDKSYQSKIPLNIFGDHLSMHMTFISIPENNLKNIIEVFKQNDLKVDRVISKPFAEGINLLNNNKDLKNSVVINFGNELSTISLYENTSLIFFKTFPFGTNLIYDDISQLCSITKDEIELIIENLNNNKSQYIDQKFFINSDYKKITIKHIKEIIDARVKEIIDYTFNQNKNLIYCKNNISKINFFFEDKVILKSLHELFNDSLKIDQNKIVLDSFLNDDFGSLFGAAELIFKGWHNEAIPFSRRKKSVISGFFERFFSI